MSNLDINTPPECLVWEVEEGDNGEKVIAFIVDGYEVAAWQFEDKDTVIAEFSRIFNLGMMKGVEIVNGKPSDLIN